MKTVFLYLLVSLASATCSLAQERRCEQLLSTDEKVKCLEQKTQEAEAKMNLTLDQVLSEYLRHHDEDDSATPKIKQIVEDEDRLTVAALRQSQTEWLAYRDSACSAVQHSYDGGTSASWAAEMCKLELTKHRTKWLKGNFDTKAVSREGQITELTQTIAKVRTGGSPTSRTEAAEHLADLTRKIDAKKVDDRTVADLVSLLDTPDDGVRYWVARCLGNLGLRAKTAIPKLQGLLADVDCLQGSKTSASGIRFALTQMGATPSPATCAP